MLKYIGDFKRLKEFGFKKYAKDGYYKFEDIEIYIKDKWDTNHSGKIEGYRNLREVSVWAFSGDYDYPAEEVDKASQDVLFKLINLGLIQQAKTKSVYAVIDDDEIVSEHELQQDAQKVVNKQKNKINKWLRQQKCYKCPYASYIEGKVDETKAPKCFCKAEAFWLSMTSACAFSGEYNTVGGGKRPQHYECLNNKPVEFLHCPYNYYKIIEIEKVVADVED